MDTESNSRTSANAPLSQPIVRATVVVLSAVLAAAVWSWWGGREQRALLALSPAARGEIYGHNLAAMGALCGSPSTPEAYAARCAEQARFLAQFPECQKDCRTLIEPFLPRPTR